MPLSGTLDLAGIEQRAPAMDSLDAEETVLEKAEMLHVMCEIDDTHMEAVLPPALHPTIPPTVTFFFIRCAASPFGPFTMAQTRIGCRAGVRPRGYLLSSAIDSEAAGEALAERWGYGWMLADVSLLRRYDRVTGSVAVAGRTILEAGLVDPEAIAGGDIFYVANMNPARTPRGLRLVQVDPEYTFHKAERGSPELDTFDPAAWGEARVVPVYPVSATIAVADIVMPRIRYLCKLDVTALQGTEKVV